MTGKVFEYTVDGDTATLRAIAPPQREKENLYYELRISASFAAVAATFAFWKSELVACRQIVTHGLTFLNVN